METNAIATGFTDIDNRIGGLMNSDLVCVAARPAIGKETFALNIATNVAKSEIPLLIISLNMNKECVKNKIINIESATNREYSSVIKNLILFEQNIDISEKNLTIEDIEAVCRKSKLEKNIGLVIIDYLQLIKLDNQQVSIGQKIEQISRRLKELAKGLNIPVIVLSQISKDVDHRKDHTPTLADFKMSSSIINYADKVFLIHRDDYYNKNSEYKDIVKVIIAKNNCGETGAEELVDIRTKYCNLEPYAKQK